MKKLIKIHSPQAMIEFGEALGRRLPANSIIALEGDLGAGKTTLTKGIGLGLGVQSIINSPTFTIMKIHEGRMKLYHLDVYRLDQVKDDFELEEYFEEGGVCVVEWASRIKSLLPSDTLWITLSDDGDQERTLTIETTSNLYKNMMKELLS